jgi:tryptophan synthase alpha chain
MNVFRQVFDAAQKENRAALVCYLMAGDPTLEESLQLFKACADGGADIIEVGFPFSDPIADGPTIQHAAERALKNKTTLSQVLSMCRDLSTSVRAPLVLMGYVNPVLAFGVDAFFSAMKHNGVHGLIVPDLPLEESALFLAAARKHERTLVPLVAPTTGAKRVERFASAIDGFVYNVAVNGVTGARASTPQLGETFHALKGLGVPVAVGFGVTTPSQAKVVAAMADGVVVGSALVNVAAQPGDVRERAKALEALVGSLRASMGRDKK